MQENFKSIKKWCDVTIKIQHFFGNQMYEKSLKQHLFIYTSVQDIFFY